MLTAIFVGLLVVACIKWIKWKIATLSTIYYWQLKGYKPPSQIEMEECTKIVVKNIIHDLFGSKTL